MKKKATHHGIVGLTDYYNGHGVITVQIPERGRVTRMFRNWTAQQSFELDRFPDEEDVIKIIQHAIDVYREENHRGNNN